MPKKIFWPATLIIMGLIYLASNLRMLPYEFLNLWPLILIIVGLGGLLISDRDDWGANKSTRSVSSSAKKSKKTKSRRK